MSATINGPLAFHLTQIGQQVTGTVTFTSKGCTSGHTASFTLPVSGTLSGSAVQLEWHPSATSSFVSRWAGTEAGTSMSGIWSPTECPGGPPSATWQVTKTG